MELIKNFQETVNYENYKENYLLSLNDLTYANHEEYQGQLNMYDFVLQKHNYNNLSIFTLGLLHKRLYKFYNSNVDYSYRTAPSYLQDLDIDLLDYREITSYLNNDLNKRAMDLFKKEINDIELYIEEVIKLSVDIFRCHPFMDGNKRITQAFMNIYFSKAKLPMLNINLNQKREEYIEALRNAINFKDYSSINEFYIKELENSINLNKNKVK